MRRIRIASSVGAIAGAALLIAACTGSPAGSPGSSAAAGGAASDPGGQPSTAGSSTGEGSVSSIAACSLLTPDEIQQALGVSVNSGTLQTGNDEQANCEWDNADSSVAVGVIVQPYDDTLWSTMASAEAAKPVSGVGEAAFKGWPHAGDLSIKQGGHEIDIGIIDFKDDQQTVDAAALALGKLVLSRL